MVSYRHVKSNKFRKYPKSVVELCSSTKLHTLSYKKVHIDFLNQVKRKQMFSLGSSNLDHKVLGAAGQADKSAHTSV